MENVFHSITVEMKHIAVLFSFVLC